MNKKVMLKWAVLMFWVGYIAQTGIAMPVESPLPLCDVSGKLGIGANCTFLTPVLNCTGVETYDVVNLSGIEVVNDASLTKLNETIYFLNFNNTNEPNDFIIRLCDGSSREIQVVSEGEELATQADMTFWETAMAMLYLGAVALYVFFGFTMRKVMEQEQGEYRSFWKDKLAPMLTGFLKYLYLLTAPALILLGIHIAREMAISNSASANITDSLMTAFQVFGGIYVLTLLVFMILLVKMSLEVFSQAGIEGMQAFRFKRQMRRKKW